MKNVLLGLLQSEKIRYLIIGGLTTLVNFTCFYILCDVLKTEVTIGNLISVCAAVLFAFWANKYIVFRSVSSDIKVLADEFIRFIAGRLLAMIIEVGGVYVLYNMMHIHAMVSKVITQVIVVVVNYIVSKFFVFNRSRKTDSRNG